MKKINLWKIGFFSCLLMASGLHAQNVAINNSGNAAYVSAILDLSNNNTAGTVGFLPPYVTLSALTTFGLSGTAAQSNGIIVYNTGGAVAAGLYYWNNTTGTWVSMGGGTTTNWLITGNNNIVDGTNFLGTTNTVPINFQINGIKSGRIDDLHFNTFLGFQSGNSTTAATTGTNNSGLGYNSLATISSASDDAALGSGALKSDNSGNNTAIGYNALTANTGTPNTAIGYVALAGNTSGTNNVAVGDNTLNSNTTTSFNTAIGSGALKINTSSNNTAVGYHALTANIGGTGNAALGYQALNANNSGFGNTAMGYQAMFSETSGSYNTALGYLSMGTGVTTGLQNSGVGYQSLQSNTSGQWNTGIGAQTLLTNTVGYLNTGIGDQALYYVTGITGQQANTAVGADAGFGLQSGEYNDYMGVLTAGAFYNNGTGNSTNGLESMYAEVSGSYNTANGAYAMYGSTVNGITGSYNVDEGFYSMFNLSSGSNNIGSGYYSLFDISSGSNNIGIGSYAGEYITSGSYNIGIGYNPFYSATFTTGSYNTAIGYEALYELTNSQYNIATGYEAGYNITSGSDNTANGYEALYTVTTGTNNTAVGYGANVSAGTATNSSAFGNGAIATASNYIKLGNAAVTVIAGQPAGYTSTSDGRFKKEIKEDVHGLDFIMKLRPVSYGLDVRKITTYEQPEEIPSPPYFDKKAAMKSLSADNDGKTATPKKITGTHFKAILPDADKDNEKLNQESHSSYDASKKFSEEDEASIEQAEKVRYNGFIAQEVEHVADSIGFDFHGIHKPDNSRDIYGLTYSEFVPSLVKAIQEQQGQIEELKKQNAELMKRLDAIENQNRK